MRELGPSTRAVAERALARLRYQPAKRWELDSNEAIKRSVAAGLGVGFVSRLAVEDELARGELETLCSCCATSVAGCTVPAAAQEASPRTMPLRHRTHGISALGE